MPSHAAFDLLQIDVHASQLDHADDAAITVLFGPRHIDRLAIDKVGQGRFGLLAIGLRFFRCVNARESDFVLCFLGVHDGDRVAVGHTHHAPMDELGRGRVAQGQGSED